MIASVIILVIAWIGALFITVLKKNIRLKNIENALKSYTDEEEDKNKTSEERVRKNTDESSW